MILWDKADPLHLKLNLDVLVGSHNESAFVEIKTDMVRLNIYIIIHAYSNVSSKTKLLL
jgi:hypothetical protein